MKKFWITVTDSATYPIEAEDEEIAIEIARDWFNERKPNIEVEEVEEFEE